MMVTLTAFADEISSDLTEQLDVLESTGIQHLEFRGVWNKNVLDLTDIELEKVRETIRAREFQVSAIGSPIGKILITDDFETHLTKFEHAIRVASHLDTKYIRIFSFFIPKGQKAEEYRNEVMNRLQELTHRASLSGITLLHENEKDIYGDITERCLDIFKTCSSPNLRCAFDPANFVQCGVKPFTQAFPFLEPYCDYIHIKDALFEGNRVVPVGQGDGEVKEVLRAMLEKGYEGFLSIEPHLAQSRTFEGFSGPELFRVATDALKDLLSELGQSWK
ncbi:sugar phosphate isomerase/epimerase [Alicyclobacillus fastidiosus]|uniref:Sugar phosphate isomerase/epimerase n=1 Tax=Alicyclobacillus fastidiosus TaxID=392011 RepID=A0ABY6ZLP4_9BACL|nr:sugar phosphate isomerase/epimerase family protein [Alicyclobacillus fastidiosus]WAH43116.1 sugar phosphate isomerase/epimerase [Alicyclobacillus fastidiosus]GMA65117.1 xylose isomerase [Alicyclobacillus fastidiosus]